MLAAPAIPLLVNAGLHALLEGLGLGSPLGVGVLACCDETFNLQRLELSSHRNPHQNQSSEPTVQSQVSALIMENTGAQGSTDFPGKSLIQLCVPSDGEQWRTERAGHNHTGGRGGIRTHGTLAGTPVFK